VLESHNLKKKKKTSKHHTEQKTPHNNKQTNKQTPPNPNLKPGQNSEKISYNSSYD